MHFQFLARRKELFFTVFARVVCHVHTVFKKVQTACFREIYEHRHVHVHIHIHIQIQIHVYAHVRVHIHVRVRVCLCVFCCVVQCHVVGWLGWLGVVWCVVVDMSSPWCSLSLVLPASCDEFFCNGQERSVQWLSVELDSAWDVLSSLHSENVQDPVVTFGEPLKHVISLRGQIFGKQKLAIRDEPNIWLRCSRKCQTITCFTDEKHEADDDLLPHPLPRLSSQHDPVCTFRNVPVYAGTTRTCVSTCAHGHRAMAKVFVIDERCPACGKTFGSRPMAIEHLQCRAPRCRRMMLEGLLPRPSADAIADADDFDRKKGLTKCTNARFTV